MSKLILGCPALLALGLLGAAAVPVSAQPHPVGGVAGMRPVRHGMSGMPVNPPAQQPMPGSGMASSQQMQAMHPLNPRGRHLRERLALRRLFNPAGQVTVLNTSTGMPSASYASMPGYGYGMAYPYPMSYPSGMGYASMGQAAMYSQGMNYGATATASPTLHNDEGGVDWPLGLRIMPPWPESKETRAALEGLLGRAAEQASSGSVDPKLAELADQKLRRLRRMLDDAEGRIPSRTADESRRFLDNLKETLKGYQQPEAPRPAEPHGEK